MFLGDLGVVNAEPNEKDAVPASSGQPQKYTEANHSVIKVLFKIPPV